MTAKNFLCSLFLWAFVAVGTTDKVETEQLLGPVVLTTWRFIEATKSAMETLRENNNSLDAIELGCNYCENEPSHCNFTVGYGGSPNDLGETTLDAMIMWAPTLELGSVGCLKRTKNAISVARKVMELTTHSILVGEDATSFANHVGFPQEPLITARSAQIYQTWLKEGCQPNYWKNQSYSECPSYEKEIKLPPVSEENHDTIGMIAIDWDGNMACGTSTNGLQYKIHGRVGDSPIPGAGAYCDQLVGGAAATGDGDVMVRFLISLRAVEEMRRGATAQEAAELSLSLIPHYYPDTSAAIVVLSITGDIGAASIGFGDWSYNYQRVQDNEPIIVSGK